MAINLSDIKVFFQTKCSSGEYLRPNIFHPHLIDELKFGYYYLKGAHLEFLLPAPGAGLLSYRKNPLIIPGLEETYVLGFKALFENEKNFISTDFDEIMKECKDAERIIGVPVRFEEEAIPFFKPLKRIEIFRY